MVPAVGDIEQARGFIPGEVVVAFVVGVVGEEVASGIEREIIGVAETMRDD